MTEQERQKQIDIMVSYLRVKLQQRGDDPNSYNPKWLRDTATKLVDGWLKDNPGKTPFVKIGDLNPQDEKERE